ncbi:MAG: 2Fe-2S iron-sulfur cluster-binding protein [Rhodospirillaceae bacterium]|nr:2Fe-2S iron-sulfur cluster-binding protein [Rhodospirillaceae bacterium]
MPVTLVLPDGSAHPFSCARGRSVMDAIRAAGLPIKAECGGAMACATCHVHVHPDWMGAVGRAGDEERDLLDMSDYSAEVSRLSCQIACTERLDGATLTLQLDACAG